MERIYSVDNLRAIAILLVVLGHSIIIYDPSWSLLTSEVECQPFFYVKQVINLIQMPLFFSISGFCYALKENGLDKKMFYDKTKRLLVPYFIICLFYMDPIKLLLGIPGYEFSFRLIIQQLLFLINNGHLWYLPTLFLMFITSAKLLCGGGKNIVIIFLLSIALSICSNYVTAFFSLNQFALYFAFFILGYLFCKYPKIIRTKRMTNLLLCFVFCGIFILVPHEGIFKKVLKLMLSMLIVWGGYKIVSNKKNSMLFFLSKNSYGIYLFHSPLIYFMYKFYPDVNPMVMLFVNFIVCGFVGIAFIYITRYLGLEFIIGERKK